MFLNLGYDDINENPINSIVSTQKKMVDIVTNNFNKEGTWLDAGSGAGAPACYLVNKYSNIKILSHFLINPEI